MANTRGALLFDLDGTLVDTIELIMSSMEFAFADFDGHKPTREEWLEGLGIPLQPLLAQHARSPEELDWLIARYRVYQGEHHDALTTAYPGVAETLTRLTSDGYAMGIVTSKFHATARKALVHTGIERHFGAIIGADSIDNPKPHPEPILRALSELGAAAGASYMIGDSPHDIRAGNDAGVATVAVTWGPFTRERLAREEPTYWIDSITQLPGLVDRG